MSLLEHSPLAERGRTEGRSSLLELVDRFGDLAALRAIADIYGWDAVQAAAPDAESLTELRIALEQRPI